MNHSTECLSNDVKQKKILIVDDDPHTTNVLSRFLLSHGHSNVESINDSRHTSYAVDDYTPDVILLDVMMPHISGLEVLRSLSKLSEQNSIAIIMLTAMEDEKTKRMALIMGANAFVQKPIGPEDLSRIVCEVLTSRQRLSDQQPHT